jgi:hypothetical protein
MKKGYLGFIFWTVWSDFPFFRFVICSTPDKMQIWSPKFARKNARAKLKLRKSKIT